MHFFQHFMPNYFPLCAHSEICYLSRKVPVFPVKMRVDKTSISELCSLQLCRLSPPKWWNNIINGGITANTVLTLPCDPGGEVCRALRTDSAGGNAVPCRFSMEGPPRGHFFSCSNTRRRLPTAGRARGHLHTLIQQRRSPSSFFFLWLYDFKNCL